MMNARETATRTVALRAFEMLCPNVAGNPYIPHWPTRMQAAFLGAHLSADPNKVFQALYGGAAGGGKSDALLMAMAQYAWKHPRFSGACFRRTYADLAKHGALMHRAIEWWVPLGVHWNGTEKKFTFPNRAMVEMAHMSKPQAHLEHQGAEYHCTAWDELTQHPTSSQYEYVGLSRVRRGSGQEDLAIPLRTLSASNPGGPGHVWVKAKFVGGIDPITGARITAECPYVRALIQDNPHLDRATYIETLMLLHPTVRAQLLAGDWEAREPGDYFRVEWFGPLLDPVEDHVAQRDKVSIRWWDLAASERPEAARTAGVLMERYRGGVRAIRHAIAFRATPGKRDARIVQQAQADGRATIVGIEIEPGSGGPAQFEALQKVLRKAGFRVAGARPKAELTKQEAKTLTRSLPTEKGKMGRCDPVASCLERGWQRRGEGDGQFDLDCTWFGVDALRSLQQQRDGLRLYAGPWTQDYLDEVEGFPGVEGAWAPLMDFADATSGAWAYLETHSFGLRIPPAGATQNEPDVALDTHPEDRDGVHELGKTRNGKWRA